MPRELIGQLAGALALMSLIPYLVSIWRGETRPARMTYFIKAVIAIIAITSYISSGARTSIWTGLVFAFTALLIFGLSIKGGIGGTSKLDLTCLGLAFIVGLVWLITKNAPLALYMSLLVKAIAYIPLVRKVYLQPKTENKLSWNMALTADTLNLFALTSLAPQISLFPIFEAVISAVVVALLLKHRLPVEPDSQTKI
jgi:hypothetical protein